MRNLYIASSAKALLKGSSKYPDLHGVVNFKQMKNGVLVTVEVFNLPFEKCKNEIYGFIFTNVQNVLVMSMNL